MFVAAANLLYSRDGHKNERVPAGRSDIMGSDESFNCARKELDEKKRFYDSVRVKSENKEGKRGN